MSCWAKRSVVETSPGKVPCKSLLSNLCHCEEAKRRGNPPKGFRSSAIIYCIDWITDRFIVVFNVNALGNTPTAPLPRPPTPHGQWHIVGCKDKRNKWRSEKIGNLVRIVITSIHNPTKWDFTRRRRISSCAARFHLPSGKFRCACLRARGGWSG